VLEHSREQQRDKQPLGSLCPPRLSRGAATAPGSVALLWGGPAGLLGAGMVATGHSGSEFGTHAELKVELVRGSLVGGKDPRGKSAHLSPHPKHKHKVEDFCKFLVGTSLGSNLNQHFSID